MTPFVTWTLAFATYLVFVGTLRLDELATGLFLGGATALWARVVHKTSRLRFVASWELSWHILRALLVIPVTIGRTAAVLGRVIIRGSEPGRAKSYRFRYGTGAQERMRRANAVLAASLTPDRFVVTVDRERQTALLHYIVRPDHKPDPRWLE